VAFVATVKAKADGDDKDDAIVYDCWEAIWRCEARGATTRECTYFEYSTDPKGFGETAERSVVEQDHASVTEAMRHVTRRVDECLAAGGYRRTWHDDEMADCGWPTAAEAAARYVAPSVAARHGMTLDMDRAEATVAFVASRALAAAVGGDGAAKRPPNPHAHLLSSLFPKTSTTGVDVCYGPIRPVYMTDVMRLDERLEAIDDAAIDAAFTPREGAWPSALGGMTFGPHDYTDEREADDRAYVLHHWRAFRAFIRQCARHQHGLIVHHW